MERWFAEITSKRIRRRTFRSVHDLIRAIRQYLRANNADPRPFVWTASRTSILRKVSIVKKRWRRGARPMADLSQLAAGRGRAE